MVVTMLEASVDADREQQLVAAYEGLGEPPPIVLQSMLLHAAGGDLWRLVTIIRSREELDAMREEAQASGEVPPGVRVFQTAGAEPALAVFDVAATINL